MENKNKYNQILEEAAKLFAKKGYKATSVKEIAEKLNIPAYLIDGADEIKPNWLSDVKTIGVTAGASAPEILVLEVVDYLYDHGATEIEEISGIEENVHFPVPEELR